jgi:ferric-chelate reductase
MYQAIHILSRRDDVPDPRGVDDFVLVLHIDLLIASFFALFAIFTLPRLFVRFSRRSEWFSGLSLHTDTFTNVRKQHQAMPALNDSTSSSDLRLKSGWRQPHVAQKAVRDNDFKLPSHRIPSWSSRFHIISTIFGREVATGYSIGRLIILLGYFCIILYAGIYNDSPFRFWVREGIITVSQVPIVYALATKNNVFGTFLAVGYEKVGVCFTTGIIMVLTQWKKLNWLHRFLGRFMLVVATLHAFGFRMYIFL